MPTGVVPTEKRPERLDSLVRRLLADTEIKIVLEAGARHYRIEYLTTRAASRGVEKSVLARTYRLFDQIRNTESSEPWDSFDLDKQTRLVTQLLTITDYKLKRLVRGWTVVCPACEKRMEGKIWEAPPKVCKGTKAIQCARGISSDDVRDIEVPVPAFETAVD